LVAYRPPREDTGLWTLEAEWPGKGRVQSVENNVKIPAAALNFGLGRRRRVHYVMIKIF